MIKYFLISIFLLSVCFTQNKTSIGLSSGISKNDYQNIGFNFGGEFFKEVSSNIFIGGRIAYNRWCLADDEIKREFSTLDVNNSVTIIELLPSMRIVSSIKNQKTQYFGQIGTGYYTFKRGWQSHDAKNFGINFGSGIVILTSKDIKLSIYPLYNIIFQTGNSIKYFTFNVGILFN